ncbi:MAG: hypothetical protein WCD79_10545, partial [Chthoniobacteraceae bacterium]
FAACALMAAQPVKAAEEKSATTPGKVEALAPADFLKVQMVTFNNNNGVGFFDRATGMLYIYDASLTKCVTIKKLKSLGEPAETIKQ